MRALAFLAVLGAAACTAPGPAPLDTRNDACAWCRMAVSDPRFAAQLLVPGADVIFFDDVGCLVDFVTAKGDLPPGSRAYVADHRTHAWVDAEAALYTRVATVEAPMRSHLMAHADASSRDADPDGRGGVPVPAADLFGSRLARRTR